MTRIVFLEDRGRVNVNPPNMVDNDTFRRMVTRSDVPGRAGLKSPGCPGLVEDKALRGEDLLKSQ